MPRPYSTQNRDTPSNTNRHTTTQYRGACIAYRTVRDIEKMLERAKSRLARSLEKMGQYDRDKFTKWSVEFDRGK